MGLQLEKNRHAEDRNPRSLAVSIGGGAKEDPTGMPSGRRRELHNRRALICAASSKSIRECRWESSGKCFMDGRLGLAKP